MCSKKHGIDWNAPGARERGQLVLYNDDFALTWPRPLLPNVKFVGPILATDAQPLAPQFEVRPSLRVPACLRPHAVQVCRCICAS